MYGNVFKSDQLVDRLNLHDLDFYECCNVDGSKCERNHDKRLFIFLFPELLTELFCSKCGRNWQDKTKVSSGALNYRGRGVLPII